MWTNIILAKFRAGESATVILSLRLRLVLWWLLWLKDPARRGLVGSRNKHPKHTPTLAHPHTHSGVLAAMQCRICGRVFPPLFAAFSLFVAIFMYGLRRGSRVRFYGFRSRGGRVTGWQGGGKCRCGGGDIGQYKTPRSSHFTPLAGAIKFNRVSQQLAQRKHTEIQRQIRIHVCLPVVKVNWVALWAGVLVGKGEGEVEEGWVEGERLKFSPLSILFHFSGRLSA